MYKSAYCRLHFHVNRSRNQCFVKLIVIQIGCWIIDTWRLSVFLSKWKRNCGMVLIILHWQDEYDALSTKLDTLLGRKYEEEVTREELISADDFWTRPRSSKATSKSGRDSISSQGEPEISSQDVELQRTQIESRMQEVMTHAM